MVFAPGRLCRGRGRSAHREARRAGDGISPAPHAAGVVRAGIAPDFASPTDYDTEGRAFLPRAYAAWLRSGENTLADRVAPAESSAEKAAPLKIVSPLPGTVAFLDPDLPGAGQRLALRIEGDVSGEKIEWRCETLRIEENAGGAWAILRPGRHEIRAIDARSGAAATTTLAVESL